jgi:hypothetical protein
MINIHNICCVSSQLFLFASIYNYYYNNIFYSYYIFSLYCSSILYHTTGNLLIRQIDMLISQIAIIIGIIISIYSKNIYPTIFAGIIIISYNPTKTYTYHAIFVHIPAFLGIMTLCI